MPEPQISLVLVQQTGAAGDKKIRLSKSLFRQVLEEHPFARAAGLPYPVYMHGLAQNYNSKIPVKAVTLYGPLLGFVNYVWRNCRRFRYEINQHGKLTCYYCPDSKETEAHNDELHVLWLTPNHELRRCFITKRLLAALGQKDIPQLFLGSVLFG